MIKQRIIAGSVLAIFAVSTIGCGQGLRSSGGTGKVTASHVEDISKEVQKAEQANEEAQNAILEANLALASIQDEKGNIKISLFKKSTSEVNTTGLLTPVIDRLRVTFETVFAKVALVKAKFNEARQLLMVALSRLDHNDPAQAALIAEVMKQMAAIDAMEAKFRTSMFQLAGKLDLAVDALSKIISGATSFIPGFGSIIGIGLDFLVMSDIRNFVAEIKMKLMGI